MSNLTLALTFILAIIFRTERLSLRSTNTQAKVMGTLVSISGALVVVLYKGPTVLSTTSERDWVKGGLLLTVGYLLFSAWSILQGLSQHYLQMQLYSRLYWQSCLCFLVFFGLIVVGGANMIEKAWHGDLVFHKHVLIPLSLCVFAFIRLLDKYRRLRRMRKKAMIVMPVDEKDE